MLLSLVCALVFGGVPALQAARIGLVGALKEGGAVRGSGRSRGRLKQGLVVAEVALSALMLVATGLLLRSFWTLASVSPGFEPEGVLAASLSPGGPAYRDRARVQAFYRDALERLREQPGVTRAAAISWTPLGSGGAATSFTISGREAPLPGQEPTADIRVVTPGLFETLRIPLLAGRDFAPDDRAGTPQRRGDRRSARARARAARRRARAAPQAALGGRPRGGDRGRRGRRAPRVARHDAARDGVPAARPGREQLHDADAADERAAARRSSRACARPSRRSTQRSRWAARFRSTRSWATRCARGASCWCWSRCSAAWRWRSPGSGSSA